MTKKDKRIIFAVTEEEQNFWKQALEQTTYTSMSKFIREVMNMVCQCITDNEDYEVVIYSHKIGEELNVLEFDNPKTVTITDKSNCHKD